VRDVRIDADAADHAEAPAELNARTVKLYSTSGSRPVIEKVPDPACTKTKVIEPGVDITVYDSIFAQPLLAGAENETDAVVVPVAAALTIEGAPETVTALVTVPELVAEIVRLAETKVIV